MHSADATTIKRRLGTTTAILALALLLGGWMAVPAAAQTEREAAAQANDFINWCFSVGGEPHAYSSTLVQCYIPSGSGGALITCDFYPERDCNTDNGDGLNPPFVDGAAPPLTRPPSGNHGGATGGTLGSDGGTMTFNGGQTGGAAFLLTTPDGGGSGDGTAAPSDPTPPSGGTVPGSSHAPKPHKGHKHHGHKPGQVTPLAGKAATAAAPHAKGKPAQHGKHGAK